MNLDVTWVLGTFDVLTALYTSENRTQLEYQGSCTKLFAVEAIDFPV